MKYLSDCFQLKWQKKQKQKHHPKSAGPVTSTENSKWKLSLYVHHLEHIINSNIIKNVGQNIYFWNIQKLFKNIYNFFKYCIMVKLKVCSHSDRQGSPSYLRLTIQKCWTLCSVLSMYSISICYSLCALYLYSISLCPEQSKWEIIPVCWQPFSFSFFLSLSLSVCLSLSPSHSLPPISLSSSSSLSPANQTSG
jgi:hypothetical protein